MKDKTKSGKPKLNVNKAFKTFYVVDGYNKFRMITVFEDRSISVGCKQEFKEGDLLEVKK